MGHTSRYERELLMNYYFAPLEGISGNLYRNIHHQFFAGVDAYFAPFISTSHSTDKRKIEMRDILPENNMGVPLVPQLLSNNGELFLEYEKAVADLGYTEVNLNLGCPSKTVVAKRRGSGFLEDLDELHRFLEIIYNGRTIDISIKTRLGLHNSERFLKLMEIYNEYPIKELTIHPRTQKDFYGGHPDLELFCAGYEMSKNPVCYNGDICTVEDAKRIAEAFPKLSAIMIGRGFLKNPGLLREIQGNGPVDVQTLRAFHDALLAGYKERLFGDKPVLFKMKEFWVYLGQSYPQMEKTLKKIKKCPRLTEYDALAREMFENIKQ